MTFSYVDPASSEKDAIRFLTGDTDSTEPMLSDEEIAFIADTWRKQSFGSPYLAASYACDAIASKLARETTVSSDGQSVSLDGLMDKFQRLSGKLREQHTAQFNGTATIFIGGIDVNEQLDQSVRPLSFGTGMHDFAEAGNQDYGDVGPVHDSGQWGERVP